MERIIKITLPTPFQVGPVNVYLLNEEALTLIDAGPLTEEAWEALNEQFRQMHIRIDDLDQIVLTHHHVDHVGLVGRILQVKELPVYAHPQADPYLRKDPRFVEQRLRFFRDLYLAHGVPEAVLDQVQQMHQYYLNFAPEIRVDRFFNEGDPLPGHPGWKVLHTPGHAPDHIALYHANDRLMIAGDHLLRQISSNAFVEPVYGTVERPRSLLVYRESLTRLLDLPIDRIYAGHGEDVTEVHALIKERLNKQHERAQHLLRLLDEKQTAFALSEKLFPKLYLQQLPLTMSETLGHLDLLQESGQVDLQEENGVLAFAAVKQGLHQ